MTHEPADVDNTRPHPVPRLTWLEAEYAGRSERRLSEFRGRRIVHRKGLRHTLDVAVHQLDAAQAPNRRTGGVVSGKNRLETGSNDRS